MFIRFDRIHERYRHTQTDRQTPHDGIGRAYAQHRAAKTVLLELHNTIHRLNITHQTEYV